MEKSISFSAPFARSLLHPGTKITHSRIPFIANTTYIDNKYDLYSITYADGSSILKVVDFVFAYAPVPSSKSLRIIIAFTSA